MRSALLIALGALALVGALFRIQYVRNYRRILRRNLPVDRRVISQVVDVYHQLKSRDPAGANFFMDTFDGGLADFVPGQVQSNAKVEMSSLEFAIQSLRRERTADPEVLSILARCEDKLHKLRAGLA
jgi:hypothetical protein